jgi:hypothetical protein
VCRALVCTEVKAVHPSQPSCCIVIHVFEIDITAWNAHCVLCLHIVPQGCLALHAPRGRTGELHSGWCRDVWKASNCSSHVQDESGATERVVVAAHPDDTAHEGSHIHLLPSQEIRACKAVWMSVLHDNYAGRASS